MTFLEVISSTPARGVYVTDRHDPRCYRSYVPREYASASGRVRGGDLQEVTRDSDPEAFAAVDSAADVYCGTIGRAWVGGDWVVGEEI